MALKKIPNPQKRNFLVLWVQKREKKRHTTLSGMVVRNFFTFSVLANRTPTGRKTRNMGFLGHFGLGRPLAFRGIPGTGTKRKTSISRC